MLNSAANLKMYGLACPTLVLVLCAGCSSGLETRKKPQTQRAQIKPRADSTGLNALYKAAKASPRSFGPVYTYAKAVTDACLASLADTRCQECGEGALRYKRRSELEPRYWPVIEEALTMLDTLGAVMGLTAEELDSLTATKGRLLWLAGRSVEEQPLIFDYASEHPDAVAVVRRRLELLRESGDAVSLASQCARSRAKTRSAPAAARLELLTACVALHPRNVHGRSDLMDYAKFLPNLTTAEEVLYRKHLVDRCESRTAEEESQCAEGCACDDGDSGKHMSRKCRRSCATCRKEKTQRLRICQQITEAPSAVVRAPRPRPAAAASARAPKRARANAAPRPKADTGRGPKPMEL